MRINLKIKKPRFPTESERQLPMYGSNWKIGDRVRFVSALDTGEHTIIKILCNRLLQRYVVILNTHPGRLHPCKCFYKVNPEDENI